MTVKVDDQAPGGADLGERRGMDETFGRDSGHQVLLGQRKQRSASHRLEPQVK
jgi:hypothetical protein